MTQEEAKEWAPIVQALAEGKPIEKMNDEGKWVKVDAMYLNRIHPDNYRIKPEPKYRAFISKIECLNEMLIHKPFGWIKTPNGDLFCIDTVFDKGVVYKHSSCRFDEYLEANYTFVDGSPFGMKVE